MQKLKLLALVPIQYRVTAIFLLCVALFSYGWTKGANSELSKQQLINQNQVIHALQTKVKQAEISERVVTQYVDRIKIVKTQGDTIIKQVPIYITQDNDNECIVPESFSVLWDAANRGDIPEASRIANETASDVKISDIAAQHATESTICRETEQQLISLQEWVRGQADLNSQP